MNSELLLPNLPTRVHVLGLLLLTFLGFAPSAQAQVPPSQSVEVAQGVRVLVPAPWFVANRATNGIEIAHPRSSTRPAPPVQPGEKPRSAEELITAEARIVITVETQPTHDRAVEKLVEATEETAERSRLLVIAGWPAIQRRRTAPLPTPGEAQGTQTESATFLTSTIAAGTLLIRFETALAPNADPRLADTALTMARTVRVQRGNARDAQRQLNNMSRSMQRRSNRFRLIVPQGAAALRQLSPLSATQPGASRVQIGNGELEIAVSNDGQHVVVSANSGFSFSDNGGQTFTRGGATPCIFRGCDGDPSLAVGRSGSFYYSWIGFPTDEPGGNPPNGATDSLSVSTDNGHTFAFRSNAVLCPATTPGVCTIPDQEHIAADRANFSGTSQDRVYLVWRNFANVSLTPRIVCSSNGGTTWSGQTIIDPSGDFPRLTVGGNGSVYVVYASNNTIRLRRFSPCDAGLVPQASVQVTTFNNVACPMPGLDRCNNGNVLSSPTVSVDPIDPNHVYVAWATSTGNGNEDIIVADSRDGGVTFSPGVRVNAAIAARRFMPWVCSVAGTAFVSWYDRRTATAANNDLTNYFVGRAITVGNVLQPGAEINLSVNADRQCATGFPCGARANNDFSSCLQSGTATRLGGCPKYGDYNGNACVANRVYTAWASATSPPGLPAAGAITLFSSAFSSQAQTLQTLTVRMTIVHPDSQHLRLFNLQIDGVTVVPNSNGGSTGPRDMSVGVHRVGETGGTSTPLSAFHVVIGGDCAPDGTVNIGAGENKICTIRNFDSFGGCATGRRCCEPGNGEQGCRLCVTANQQCP